MIKELINETGLTDNNTVSSITEDKLNFASKEEVIEAIEHAYKNIPDFYKRLIYFSLKLIRVYFKSDNFRGMAADDVVSNVIEKVINLERKWYRDKIPDFTNFLRLSILSYIKNEKKRKKGIDPIYNSIDIYDEEGEIKEEIFKYSISEILFQDLNDENIEIDFETLYNKCLKELENDETAFFVFVEKSEGKKSNIEIAKDLKISVKEVENAYKRIKYKLKKIINVT